MSNSNLSASFDQLRQILTTSNDTIGQFRNTNKAFHASLIEKTKAILVSIQNIASNPNIQRVITQLDQSQADLSDMQQQLQASNAKLVELQQQIAELQQQKTALENQIKTSGDTNGEAKKKIDELQKQVDDCLADQNKNIDNIAQVNDLLARQVQNINEMLQESTTYNSEYDQEINAIASNLEIVVNMLNGTNRPGPGPSPGPGPGNGTVSTGAVNTGAGNGRSANTGTVAKPPFRPAGAAPPRPPFKRSNATNVIADYKDMATRVRNSGGKRRRTRKAKKSTMKKKMKMKKGGYNWSNTVSNDSQSAKSSSSTPKSKTNFKNYRLYSRKKK